LPAEPRLGVGKEHIMVNLKSWFPFRFSRQGRQAEAPRRSGSSAPLAITQIRDEMEQMFDRLWANPLASLESKDRWFGDFAPAEFMPKLDVTDDASFLKVTLEAPGVDMKDVDIEVQEGILTISGEKRHEETQKDDGCYRTERSYGFFRRAIPLPSEVDATKAEARLDKGVLTVKLPKTEVQKKQAVRVAVKA
jgi:HSP20 family protein